MLHILHTYINMFKMNVPLTEMIHTSRQICTFPGLKLLFFRPQLK